MKKAIKQALLSAYLMANRRLVPLFERFLVLCRDRAVGPANTPIFIIGAPRSGTTLTFQLMVSYFKLGYLTNTHCMIFGAPFIASFFLRRGGRKISFDSDYGRTSGRYGPSECGEWWYRFFPRDPAYVTRQDVPIEALEEFQRSLRLIVNAECRPVVFKNLYAGLRLNPITAMFPSAIFIHVQRNRVDNAVSILEGRRADNGNFEAWWSVPPPGYEDWIDKSAAEQVMAQIDLIDTQITKDISDLRLENQVLVVNYEEICNNPAAFLGRIQTFLASRNLDLPLVGDPPKKFKRQSMNQLPKEIMDALLVLEKGTATDA